MRRPQKTSTREALFSSMEPTLLEAYVSGADLSAHVLARYRDRGRRTMCGRAGASPHGAAVSSPRALESGTRGSSAVKGA